LVGIRWGWVGMEGWLGRFGLYPSVYC